MLRTRASCVRFVLMIATLSTLVAPAQRAFAAGNIDAGQAKVQQLCAECHRPRDWSGETTAALQSLIADIVAGKVKHSQRKLELTPQDVADIAAYWTSGRK